MARIMENFESLNVSEFFAEDMPMDVLDVRCKVSSIGIDFKDFETTMYFNLFFEKNTGNTYEKAIEKIANAYNMYPVILKKIVFGRKLWDVKF